MTLYDITRELMVYLVRFREQAPTLFAPSLEKTAKRLDEIFKQMDEAAAGRISLSEPYQKVRYALVALADEVVLESGWTHGNAWRENCLEHRYYQSNAGPDKFFDFVKDIKTLPQDVLAIYYLCLGLGFGGAAPPHDPKLAAIKRALLIRLPGEEQPKVEPARPAPRPAPGPGPKAEPKAKPKPPAKPKPAPAKPAKPSDAKPKAAKPSDAKADKPPIMVTPPKPKPGEDSRPLRPPKEKRPWIGAVAALALAVVAVVYLLPMGADQDAREVRFKPSAEQPAAPAAPAKPLAPKAKPGQVAAAPAAPAKPRKQRPAPKPEASAPGPMQQFLSGGQAKPPPAKPKPPAPAAPKPEPKPLKAAKPPPPPPAAPAAAQAKKTPPPSQAKAAPKMAAKPKAKPAPASEPAKLAPGYYLQTGVFVGPIQSGRLAKRLRGHGLETNVRLEDRPDGKGRWYVVRVGPAKNRQAAKEMRRKIKDAVGIKAILRNIR